jgi:hypothetical protein
MECQLNPTLFLTLVQRVGIHDACGVIQARPLLISVDVITNERSIQKKRKLFSGNHKQHVEKQM